MIRNKTRWVSTAFKPIELASPGFFPIQTSEMHQYHFELERTKMAYALFQKTFILDFFKEIDEP